LALKVFITGASSGIGEALAVYYAGQGATLGLAARRAEFLDGLNQRLGGQHACYALDVCDAPALARGGGDFIARFGAPDIIIANAGVSAGTLTEFEEDLAVFAGHGHQRFRHGSDLCPVHPGDEGGWQSGKSAGWSASPRLPAFVACRGRKLIRRQRRRPLPIWKVCASKCGRTASRW
jgi:hypothetical protein